MLSAFAVRRWQFTLVLFVALAVLGVQSLLTIPKTEDPIFPMATFAVAAVLPGATPTDLEKLVVDPLEAKLKALEDVKTLQTEIEDGLAVTRVEFRAGVNLDKKRDDVLRETTALRPTLPAELVRFDVLQFSASKVSVSIVALVSAHAEYRELDVHARALRRRLENSPGVGEVEIAGLPKQEVTVSLDLDRMVALGVHPAELLSAIAAESTNVPAGVVEGGSRRFNVKTSGDYVSVDEIRSTIIRSVNGSAIRVADVAEIELRDAPASPMARFEGKRAVLVAATQRDGENVFEVKKGIEAELDAFASTLPATSDIHLVRGFDQSLNVRHRLDNFSRDFALAILLVLVTLLPLGLRAALVVMVSIPLSLSIGLLGLHMAGFSINQLSIVGFVLALGLLVDDSVVVVENITRHLRHGLAPREAAINATREITVSVLGCTATLLFAFFPLLVLPGTPGQFIRSMPVAVIFTIGASLLVSLTIVPFLSSRLLVAGAGHGNVFYRAMTWAIEGTYRRVLTRAVGRPKSTLIFAAILFGASLALIPRIGFSLFPKAGIPQFLVRIEAAEGASLGETDRAARFVEDVLARHPEVARVSTTVGKGHPQVYYNVVPRNERANVADVHGEIRSHDAREVSRIIDTLRDELQGYAGARIDLDEFENGPPVDAPIAIRLLGDDTDALEKGANAVEAILRATEGTRDVRNPARERRTDLRVRVDREKAAVLGVVVADLDRAVRLGVGGIVAGKYRDPGSDEAYDIRVTVRPPSSDAVATANVGAATPAVAQARVDGAHVGAPAVDVLERLWVTNSKGAPMPLSQIASIALEPSPTKIRHHAKERSVTVTAHVRTGFNTDRLTREVLAKLGTTKLPTGIRTAVAGELENREESFGGLGTAILVAVFGVIAILVLEFRTFRSTVIVASVIPLGVIGGLFALLLRGDTLSFTATVGFVALMGIEVKNSILLVDFTNQLREQGVALDDAIRRAGEARFVPILLTTLTAIGGLVPLVLERSSLYSPLAVVILGGLVSSTLLTRVVTPVLYKLVAPAVEVRTSARNSAEPY